MKRVLVLSTKGRALEEHKGLGEAVAEFLNLDIEEIIFEQSADFCRPFRNDYSEVVIVNPSHSCEVNYIWHKAYSLR